MADLDIAHYRNRHSFKSKLGRALWNVVWLLMARWTPEHVGVFNSWRVFLLRAFGARIGRRCVVKASCEVWQPWNLTVGDYVALSEHVVCYTVDRITIGRQTTISRGVFLCCASHDVTSRSMELSYAPIEIGANAWIAARSIVLPGRKIGEGAVVGAGAVVAADVEPWTIVAGNPAKFIKKRVISDV